MRQSFDDTFMAKLQREEQEDDGTATDQADEKEEREAGYFESYRDEATSIY